MSRKVKREISTLSFSMNRFYRRISTVKPSALVFSVLAIAIAVFLFGGGLYDIIMKPYTAIYYGGTFVFLYPQLGEQFITDSIVAMSLYSLGIIGLVAIYQSTKYAYKPRQAYMMFIIGVVLLFLSYIFLEAAIERKVS
jgi:hypothetical protein